MSGPPGGPKESSLPLRPKARSAKGAPHAIRAHSTTDAARQGVDHIPDPAQRALLCRYLDGTISGEMTLMYWLKAAPDAEALRDQFAAAMGACARAPSQGAVLRALTALSTLVERNFEGCQRIARMVKSGVDSDAPARSVEEGIAFCRNLFDWSVAQSSESSVALYSLGSAQILAAATAEIVALLQRWQVLGPARDLLEIGCGIGRFQQALSTQSRSVTGIDVSSNMIAAARERCAGLLNVALVQCSGHDLAQFGSDRFDLVYAVDSFPYLHQAGMPLVERHFAEARRVLKRGGDFVILEFSYRGDIGLDNADVHRLAAAHGFSVKVSGMQPFSLWDGAAFHLSTT